MSEKEDYQKRIEEQFNQLSAKIDELLAKVEGRTKKEFEEQKVDLSGRLKTAREKYEELKKESGEAWKDLKPGFERAWQELKGAIERAASRFK